MNSGAGPRNSTDTTDRPLLDLLRREGSLTVAELAERLGVTANAVRVRLTRLTDSGLIERQSEPGGRGRPRHTYRASAEAQRRLGQNYADLALALWEEMMQAVDDRKLRRLLFGRVTDRLADLYRAQLDGGDWQGRLVQLGAMLGDRGIEAEILNKADSLGPTLRQHSCPYHALAELDRGICAMERKMFEKVVGQALRLSQCRLDGDRCCDFEPKAVVARTE
ncbi:MarR family transcriptional regulator [Isosphaeraceae bacterium EP7]